VLRGALHLDVGEMPDPAVIAKQVSLVELAFEPACGPVTLAEIRTWVRLCGYEIEQRAPPFNNLSRKRIPPLH
jgi:hypothetical protein